jgi:hypothetical protein
MKSRLWQLITKVNPLFFQSVFFSFAASPVSAAAIGLALNFAFIFFSAPEKKKRVLKNKLENYKQEISIADPGSGFSIPDPGSWIESQKGIGSRIIIKEFTYLFSTQKIVTKLSEI